MLRSDHNTSMLISLIVLLILSLAAVPLPLSAEEPVRADQFKPGQERPEKNDRSGGGMITKDEMLTLNRCIEIALKQNPSIVAAVNTVDVNRSRVGEARSNYYPQLSATGAYSRS